MGKLTWTRYGLLLLAGLAGFACSQEAREPLEVGAAQVELRSDLVLPETPGASTVVLAEENPDHPGQSANSMPATQRIALSELGNYSQDRAYDAVQRYEFLPALLKDPKTRKSSAQQGDTHAQSWTLADKHWVRAGKGFGVAAEGMAPPGTVHLDDASYYSPTVALKPYPKRRSIWSRWPSLSKAGSLLFFTAGRPGLLMSFRQMPRPPGIRLLLKPGWNFLRFRRRRFTCLPNPILK